MVDELRRCGVSGSIELDESRFSLVTGDGQEYLLDNAYAEWQRAPRLRRGQVLRRYASIAELLRFRSPRPKRDRTSCRRPRRATTC